MRTYQKGQYTIHIETDDCSESPRDWDNLGKMVCKHNRYTLGDKESENIPWAEFDSWDEVQSYLEKNYDIAIILPLFLHDHSSLSMNTGGFNDRWDSGQVGFIFIERDKIKREYGVKRISKKLLEKVTGYLKGEVETYSKYLGGEVYWYQIINTKTGEEIDSCGGWYGHIEVEEECNRIVDALPQSNAEDFIINQIPNILECKI